MKNILAIVFFIILMLPLLKPNHRMNDYSLDIKNNSFLRNANNHKGKKATIIIGTGATAYPGNMKVFTNYSNKEYAKIDEIIKKYEK